MYNNYFVNRVIRFPFFIFLIAVNLTGLVSKLKTLNVADNPITVPPKDVIALGCSSILSYLQSEWKKLHPNEPGMRMAFVERKNLKFVHSIAIPSHYNYTYVISDFILIN